MASAGHVDHGKSTLVMGLTGTDPDRWPEEKARGLTIDLGFAATVLPSGNEIAFVDVPGHRRLVKNMLAGVGSVDACLFVVAATEGWKEQSEEHLRILELAGVQHGIVALTKVGLVENERMKLVAEQVRERVSGTFLADAEMIEVDVPANLGVEQLREALDRLVERVPPAGDYDRPRLWIDRSFTVRGFGTVVTGTLIGGSLALDNEVVIEPDSRHCRIRSLQTHYSRVEEVSPGRRVAVNLSGVASSDVHRGQALVRAGQWHLTTTFDATLGVLTCVSHLVGNRGAYTVYTGSGEFSVRLRLIGCSQVAPGEVATARFWLSVDNGLPLLPGDRYVLRESGRFETVGGGEILDVEPVLPTKRAAPSRSVSRVVRERGWVDADHLLHITGEWTEPTIGRWVVDPIVFAATLEDIVSRCKSAGREGVELASLNERERAILENRELDLHIREGRILDSAVPLEDGVTEHACRVLRALELGWMSPEQLPISDRGALRELERVGLAIQSSEVWFSAASVQIARGIVVRLLEGNDRRFTVSQARDALGTSRKYVLALLVYFDSIGVTRRYNDYRIPGQRLGGGNEPH